MSFVLANGLCKNSLKSWNSFFLQFRYRGKYRKIQLQWIKYTMIQLHYFLTLCRIILQNMLKIHTRKLVLLFVKYLLHFYYLLCIRVNKFKGRTIHKIKFDAPCSEVMWKKYLSSTHPLKNKKFLCEEENVQWLFYFVTFLCIFVVLPLTWIYGFYSNRIKSRFFKIL